MKDLDNFPDHFFINDEDLVSETKKILKWSDQDIRDAQMSLNEFNETVEELIETRIQKFLNLEEYEICADLQKKLLQVRKLKLIRD